jgi:hypothetical protein
MTPTAKKRTVTPRRRRNGDLRTREYLTEAEVDRSFYEQLSNADLRGSARCRGAEQMAQSASK